MGIHELELDFKIKSIKAPSFKLFRVKFMKGNISWKIKVDLLLPYYSILKIVITY